MTDSESPAPQLRLTALPGIPEILPGADLPALIAAALRRAGLTLEPHDVLVVTSKIVSKAEGRFARLTNVTPGPEAQAQAAVTRKDARLVQLILNESERVVRRAPHVLVVRHRLGFVSANAGIDQSNVDGTDDTVLLLPEDPDASADRLRAGLLALTGVPIGIVISDSHGRPHRYGNAGVCIGAAGLPVLRDLRGTFDRHGRELRISIQAYADMIASAAGLLTGEGAEGLPVVHVRGLHLDAETGRADDQYRPPESDLYL